MADDTDLTSLTVDLLAAFVSHNNVRSEDLAGLIQSTHRALAALTEKTDAAPDDAKEEFTPATTVRKSLSSPDHILSMIDGKPYRSLKRHLTSNGLTFEEYKSRYNLPANYPSVAPGYSEARREVAKRLGLGRKPKAAEPDAAQNDAAPEPKPRGRRKATPAPMPTEG